TLTLKQFDNTSDARKDDTVSPLQGLPHKVLPMSATTPAAEAVTFLERYSTIDSIDLLISDLNGVMRGKRIPRDNLVNVFSNGINLPASLFAMDINGHTIEETGLGLSSGDGDRVCRPIPSTLLPCPWLHQGRHGQLLMSMFE